MRDNKLLHGNVAKSTGNGQRPVDSIPYNEAARVCDSLAFVRIERLSTWGLSNSPNTTKKRTRCSYLVVIGETDGLPVAIKHSTCVTHIACEERELGWTRWTGGEYTEREKQQPHTVLSGSSRT